LATKKEVTDEEKHTSIIVPVLDDAAALAEHLPHLVATGAEIIVVDGGSTDETVTVAENLSVRTVQSEPGRGVQLNAGARAATGDPLLFVHADTTLPENALAKVEEAISRGACGGGFLLRFDSDRPIFRLGSWLINRRTRSTGVPLGDQAQFTTRAAYEALGGYPDWPILEDLDFARRLKHHGKTVLIDSPVITSPRRQEGRGILRNIVTNWVIWALFFAGVSPHRLAKLYRSVR